MNEDEKRDELIHLLEQQADATFNKTEELKLRAWAMFLDDLREIKRGIVGQASPAPTQQTGGENDG